MLNNEEFADQEFQIQIQILWVQGACKDGMMFRWALHYSHLFPQETCIRCL
jgi:hypothetical protein